MKSFLVVILLAAIVYILPLNVRPISTPDESRYAEIPREMITSGDWIVPHLNGVRYFEKPVMGYWITAISILLFGENNFATRLPCALSALMSALFVFLVVRKTTSDDRKSALTAAGFLSCFLVFAIGVFNVLDSLFSMFVTGMMTFFFLAANEPRAKQRNILLAVCGISCGFAFLTKGFLAFALPAIAILPYLAWERKIKDIFRLAWIPAIAAALVILPWAALIHLRDNDYWYQFFYVEHVQRFFSPQGKAQHAEPWWYLFQFLLGGMVPWLFVLPAALIGIRHRGFTNPLTRFAVCWLCSFFIFFSISSGKLGTYILPCFPPLMILVIDGLLQHLETGRSRIFSWGGIILAILMLSASSFLVISQTSTGLEQMRAYYDSESWKWMLLAAGFASFGLLLLMAAKATTAYGRLAVYAASPLILFFAIHFAIPHAFRMKARECMDPVGMIKEFGEKLAPDSIIISDSYLAPAICWAYKRTDIYLYKNGGELTYGLQRPEAKHRLVQTEDLSFFNDISKKPVTMITDIGDYEDESANLPKPFFLLKTNGLVFAQYRFGEEEKK